GNVPAARPSTYIDSGTVASDMSGASVAPTIEPVAKITAELAPVSACAAARRTTLARTRASSPISLAKVTSNIGISARAAFVDSRHYGGARQRGQPAQTSVGHAEGAIGQHLAGRAITGLRSIKFRLCKFAPEFGSCQLTTG